MSLATLVGVDLIAGLAFVTPVGAGLLAGHGAVP